MKPRRVAAIARKEFLHIVRDPRSLGMAIAIPMLMLVLFGYALTMDVDNVPMIVWDQSGTHASREFVSRFDLSPYFSLVGHVDSPREIDEALNTRRAIVAMVLPSDFATRLETGRSAPVQMIVDGTDSNTATIALGYAEAIARTYGQEVALAELRRLGGPPLRVPLDLRPRVWFNADMESKNYIIPGLIAVIMMVIAALLTSLTVAREWERGTMEQLISTPVKGPELILGKLIPYFAIGMFDVLLAVLMGEFVFRVPLRGNPALIFGIGSIFLAGSLAMGMLISIVTKSQLLASQIAMITTFLPAFLLSGFMVPIANMPRIIQMITYVVPARYFVRVLHGLYLKGVGLELLALEAALLTVYGTVMVLLAKVKFKKKLM
ncbi:MAG: ABC transporter permease [Thermoguttaceae bacterium]|jgi:ABC-2 type transport system permease protein|nr:ABC transporter permease [Thermoguttaceae bacterium]